MYPDPEHWFKDLFSYIQAADMGVYTCTASNLAGAITTNITLNVLESPRFVKPMQDRKVSRYENYFPFWGTGYL
jgi:hypothetical protein